MIHRKEYLKQMNSKNNKKSFLSALNLKETLLKRLVKKRENVAIEKILSNRNPLIYIHYFISE